MFNIKINCGNTPSVNTTSNVVKSKDEITSEINNLNNIGDINNFLIKVKNITPKYFCHMEQVINKVAIFKDRTTKELLIFFNEFGDNCDKKWDSYWFNNKFINNISIVIDKLDLNLLSKSDIITIFYQLKYMVKIYKKDSIDDKEVIDNFINNLFILINKLDLNELITYRIYDLIDNLKYIFIIFKKDSIDNEDLINTVTNNILLLIQKTNYNNINIYNNQSYLQFLMNLINILLRFKKDSIDNQELISNICNIIYTLFEKKYFYDGQTYEIMNYSYDNKEKIDMLKYLNYIGSVFDKFQENSIDDESVIKIYYMINELINQCFINHILVKDGRKDKLINIPPCNLLKNLINYFNSIKLIFNKLKTDIIQKEKENISEKISSYIDKYINPNDLLELIDHLKFISQKTNNVLLKNQSEYFNSIIKIQENALYTNENQLENVDEEKEDQLANNEINILKKEIKKLKEENINLKKENIKLTINYENKLNDFMEQTNKNKELQLEIESIEYKEFIKSDIESIMLNNNKELESKIFSEIFSENQSEKISINK